MDATFKNVIVAGFVVLALTSCGNEKSITKPEPEPSLVKTMVVGETDGTGDRSYPGTVVAGKRVDLAFQVKGQIIQLPVVEGQKVDENQLLAALDKRDYQNHYDASRAREIEATQNFARASELVKGGHISKADYDQVKAKFDIARSDRAIAQKALEDTQLRASFAGVVATKYVENFENIVAKQKIVSLQDISSIEIEIHLPEQDLILAKRASSAEKQQINYKNKLIFNALPEREFQVKFKEISTQADSVTQTYRVTLMMPAPKDVNILPGMTATFYLDPDVLSKSTTILIPSSAVAIDDKGQHFVYVFDPKTSTVQKRVVKVGGLSGKNIEINDGLVTNDRIVTAGVAYLMPGMKVKIMTGKPGKQLQ